MKTILILFYLRTSDYSTGRLSKLVSVIAEHNFTNSPRFFYVCDDICSSNLNGISLAEYIYALPHYCHLKHDPTCTLCPSLLTVASDVLNNGFSLLSSSFKSAFPQITYHSYSAKRLLLQLPLVSLRVGDLKSGYIFEKVTGVCYRQFLHLLNVFHAEKCSKKLAMSKKQLSDILSIAQSDRERECIRYTAVVASGFTSTAARKHYGLENTSARMLRVNEAIEDTKAIQSAIDGMAHLQEKAALSNFGITISDSTDSSDDGISVTDERPTAAV